MSEKKIDFSTLDPASDPEHWEDLIASVVFRAQQNQRRPKSLVILLSAWARPAFAAAAVFALAIWSAHLLWPQASTANTAVTIQQRDPVTLLSSWAASGGIPSDADPWSISLDDYGREK